MRRASYFIILSLLSLAIIVATVLMKRQMDTQAPVIRLPEEIPGYTEGTPLDDMLPGVSAWDSVDGDLTEEVFVYEIVPIQATGMAKVVYAVCDSSNNVATADTMVTYSRKKETLRVGLGGEPVIRLTSNGTTISKGQLFDPHEFIYSLYDDTDSADELSNRLVVKGSYDLTRIGHYRLQMYVTDSEGKESNKVEFLLVVE